MLQLITVIMINIAFLFQFQIENTNVAKFLNKK